MATRSVSGTLQTPRLDAVRLRSAALVVLAGALWSTGGVLVRLVESADGRQIVLWRSLFTALLIVAVLAWRRRGGLLANLVALGWYGPLAGICLVGAFLGFVESVLRIPVANALFILASQPLLAAGFGWLLLGERPRGATLLAMPLALSGIVLMVAPGLGPADPVGSLCAFGSALGFALFSVALRGAPATDKTPAVLQGALLAALVCAIILIANAGPAALLIPPQDIALCAIMGIGQIGLGMLAFAAGARHLTAAELGLLALSEVVLGPVWAWLVLGEIPAIATLAGGALVLVAVAGQVTAGAGMRPRS